MAREFCGARVVRAATRVANAFTVVNRAFTPAIYAWRRGRMFHARRCRVIRIPAPRRRTQRQVRWKQTSAVAPGFGAQSEIEVTLIGGRKYVALLRPEPRTTFSYAESSAWFRHGSRGVVVLPLHRPLVS